MTPLAHLTQRVVLERELRALLEANSRLRNVVLAMAKEEVEAETGMEAVSTTLGTTRDYSFCRDKGKAMITVAHSAPDTGDEHGT